MTTDEDAAGTSRSAPAADISATGAIAGGDWPARAADMVEDVVAAVHDRVVRPLLLAGRAAVFGIVIAAMTLVLGVLLAIAVVRLLDNYAFGHRVWASDALVGGVITVIGLAAWSLRRPRGADRSRT
ncbi:MAG TPA: hypothetical protein VKR22_14190 [Acidimicrobiales bacterium]|nr:hypothetical protein [Acidimicrobiales bacterium]